MTQPELEHRVKPRIFYWCDHLWMLRVLACIAFVESALLPIPVELIYLPMCLASPKKAYRFALVATVASLAGAIYGYSLGHFGAILIDALVTNPLLVLIFDNAKILVEQSEIKNLFFAGLSPIPYPVLTLSAGSSGIGALLYISLFVSGHAIRFFFIAYLLLHGRNLPRINQH